jgi:hypothetical protein
MRTVFEPAVPGATKKAEQHAHLAWPLKGAKHEASVLLSGYQQGQRHNLEVVGHLPDCALEYLGVAIFLSRS